jgi:hypothetical protein
MELSSPGNDAASTSLGDCGSLAGRPDYAVERVISRALFSIGKNPVKAVGR